MKSRARLIVAVAALAVFGVLGFMNFKKSMTPYVTFAEARAAGRTVQVAGFPDHSKSAFDASVGGFRFEIANEDGDVLPVVYRGGKPGNFDQANSVVVIGHYDGTVMEAKQLLVKCPSKYESEGTEHPGEGGKPAAVGAEAAAAPPQNGS